LQVTEETPEEDREQQHVVERQAPARERHPQSARDGARGQLVGAFSASCQPSPASRG
jgi:hypothetical protein